MVSSQSLGKAGRGTGALLRRPGTAEPGRLRRQSPSPGQRRTCLHRREERLTGCEQKRAGEGQRSGWTGAAAGELRETRRN